MADTEEQKQRTVQESAEHKICAEILDITCVYHEQAATSYGVDTPGGLEHMGDVWALFLKWERALQQAINE